jgi:transposase
VRAASIWPLLLGFEQTRVERVELDEDCGAVVVHARPHARRRSRCGVCGRRCPRYDRGEGRRRWRGLDWGTVQVFVEADAPRVSCRDHGVVVAAVPWARHGAGHTVTFDAQVAWLATKCSKAAVTALMRIAWRTVGNIVARYWAEVSAQVDLLDGLTRIGIDEISYKKGHRYLVVVVDHDTGRLVWAGEGREAATLEGFFDQLGDERTARITHVSADGADWITRVLRRRCPQAMSCLDPFHVVKWGVDALDIMRRKTWNEAAGRNAKRLRVSGFTRVAGQARQLKHARWALWKNPDDLTEAEQAKLAWIAKTHPTLHRAWALKEGLRTVFAIAKTSPTAAVTALDRWISWARRCRITPFVELQRRVARYRNTIINTIHSGLSNGLIESANTKIRLITRMAFGFKSADALIALAMLSLGGYPPQLPGR